MKNINKKTKPIIRKINSFFIHVFVFSFLMLPTLIFAQQAIGLQNPIAVDSISDLITIVVRVVRYIAIPFVVIMIMYAGWLYIAAGAGISGKEIDDAHRTIKFVVIGAFVILSAELIAQVIANTLSRV